MVELLLGAGDFGTGPGRENTEYKWVMKVE